MGRVAKAAHKGQSVSAAVNSGAGGCYRNSMGEGREKKQRLIQVEGRERFDIRGFWMETGTFHRNCWSSAKGQGLSYFPARCALTVVSAQPLATCKGRHLTEGMVSSPEGERVSEASSQHSTRRNLHACVTECVRSHPTRPRRHQKMPSVGDPHRNGLPRASGPGVTTRMQRTRQP